MLNKMNLLYNDVHVISLAKNRLMSLLINTKA